MFSVWRRRPEHKTIMIQHLLYGKTQILRRTTCRPSYQSLLPSLQSQDKGHQYSQDFLCYQDPQELSGHGTHHDDPPTALPYLNVDCWE